MSISGFDVGGVFSGLGASSTIHNAEDTDRIAANLTKFLGKHTLKFGGEFTRGTYNSAQANGSSGSFSFSNSFTSKNPVTGSGGLGLASFLLGYPASGSASNINKTAAEQLYPAVYMNDNWRLNQRITLHMGLRWENVLPYTERHNRLSYFDAAIANPLVAAAGLGDYPGSVELVSSATRSSRFADDPNWNEFSPRFGITYRMGASRVLGAGYGIFWLGSNTLALFPKSDTINAFSTAYTASINSGLTPANNISNPFPGGIISAPGRNDTYRQIVLGKSISEAFPHNPQAYAQQWNLSVQQQIGSTIALNAAYAGAKGTHLPFNSITSNQLPDSDLALGTGLLTSVANPFYGLINPTYALGAATTSAGQLLLPFPQYSTVTNADGGLGASTYHSLQVTAQKRLSNGASINAAYTWSKFISNTDSMINWVALYTGVQDSNNLRGEKSLASSDAPQVLNIYYIYDVPVGHGRRFLPDMPRAANYVIGDWTMEGITGFMSGFPLGLSTNSNLTHSFGGGSRPNVVAGCSKVIGGAATSKLNKWFNTACFTQPAAFTFGNESRLDSSIRKAGQANWDLSAVKKFPFGNREGPYVEFRTEAFNLFNRVQFGGPGTSLGTSNYGVVSSQANNPRLIQFALKVAF